MFAYFMHVNEINSKQNKHKQWCKKKKNKRRKENKQTKNKTKKTEQSRGAIFYQKHQKENEGTVLEIFFFCYFRF